MSDEKTISTSDTFTQKVVKIGEIQIISASGQIFNHVDDKLPMWAEDGDRLVQAIIVFDKAFKDAPSISLGLMGIDAAHDQNLRVWLTAKDVRASGFTLEFSTWGDTHIARAAVSWQAIGSVKADILAGADKALNKTEKFQSKRMI